MFHLAANFVAIGQTVDTDVPAKTDQVLQIQNSHFVLSKPMQIMAAYASSATLTRTKLKFPSINQYGGTWLRPVNATLLPFTDPNVADYRQIPFTVPAQEELQYASTSGLACGTENHYVLTWLQDSFVPAPQGQIYTLRATSTTAGVASTWTDITVTYDNQLPSGRYAVVGSNVHSTTGVAHRMIFDDQLWRPGTLSFATTGLRNHPMFEKGRLGVWGYFTTISLPRFQILDNATGNSHTIYLDCVRVA